MNINYQVTSTTGCSSVLLANNIQINKKNLNVMTIHSFSGIGLCQGENHSIIDRAINRMVIRSRWNQVNVLIIDEVSMMSCKMFNIIEAIASNCRNNILPFGQIQLILLGDFLQLPPIEDKNDPETAQFCFESDTWYKTIPLRNHIELKTIFRQKDDIFRKILSEIRIGEISATSEIVLKSIVNKVYDIEANFGLIPMQILPTRNEVAFVNKNYYDKVDAPELIFNSVLSTKETMYIDGTTIPQVIINKFKSLPEKIVSIEINNLKNNIPTIDSIHLKVGVPVMIVTNIDIEDSLCNGTIGIIRAFHYKGTQKLPVIRFGNGNERMIAVHKWQHSEYPNITLSQIPLTLAYASSIHKQQGSSITLAKMNLGRSIFEDSQIYVALSRMTSLDGLYLDSFESSKIKVNKKAKEFYEAFPIIDYEYELLQLSKIPIKSSKKSTISSFFNKLPVIKKESGCNVII